MTHWTVNIYCFSFDYVFLLDFEDHAGDPFFFLLSSAVEFFLTSGMILDVGGAPGSFRFSFLSSATNWNRSVPFWLGFPWQHWGCFLLCWLFSLYNIPRVQPLGLHNFSNQRNRLLTRVVEPFERWLVVSPLWPNWAFKIWTQLLAVLLVPLVAEYRKGE